MEDAFLQFKAHNESKNIFKAARTPAVFFAIAVTMYILSGIFGLVGLYTIANVCNLIMGIGLLTLVLWAYIRYMNLFKDMCETTFYYHAPISYYYLLFEYYLDIVENSEKLAHK